MSFLQAEWKKLAIANYQIDPAILQQYLPAKTELDFWENRCYISLVGFMFLNTKLMGVAIPYHRDFEEVNLRFYVKHQHQGVWKRGVVFIKELVPRPALTFVANNLYKEHYETVEMGHVWAQFDDHQHVEYSWKSNAIRHRFAVDAALTATAIQPYSEEEFITEHYWGYTKAGANTTFEYEVTHPRWNHFRVNEYDINVEFGLVYGADFRELNHIHPTSVMLAEGSKITVESKRRI